jgi:predicted O-methyltransferase YrrM
MLSDALLPVSREAGKLIYAVARSISAKRIVEFGIEYSVKL